MDREKFTSLLQDSISMMCKNSLVLEGVKSVQGLLGITLQSDEVFLINIQECFEVAEPEPVPSAAEEGITLVISPKRKFNSKKSKRIAADGAWDGEESRSSVHDENVSLTSPQKDFICGHSMLTGDFNPSVYSSIKKEGLCPDYPLVLSDESGNEMDSDSLSKDLSTGLNGDAQDCLIEPSTEVIPASDITRSLLDLHPTTPITPFLAASTPSETISSSLTQPAVEGSSTDPKPFKCVDKNCSYASERKYNLVRHIRLVHQGVRIQCKKCGKMFSDAYQCRQHWKFAHNASPFSCWECGEILTSSSSLEVHMKTVHKDCPTSEAMILALHD